MMLSEASYLHITGLHMYQCVLSSYLVDFLQQSSYGICPWFDGSIFRNLQYDTEKQVYKMSEYKQL